MTLPVRIRFDELAKENMPRSSTARFSERWQKSVGDEGFIEGVVERWRASSSGTSDLSANMSMFADAMGISGASEVEAAGVGAAAGLSRPPTGQPLPASGMPVSTSAGRATSPQLRRDLPSTAPQRGVSAGPATPEPTGTTMQSLREKLLQRSR